MKLNENFEINYKLIEIFFSLNIMRNKWSKYIFKLVRLGLLLVNFSSISCMLIYLNKTKVPSFRSLTLKSKQQQAYANF